MRFIPCSPPHAHRLLHATRHEQTFFFQRNKALRQLSQRNPAKVALWKGIYFFRGVVTFSVRGSQYLNKLRTDGEHINFPAGTLQPPFMTSRRTTRLTLAAWARDRPRTYAGVTIRARCSIPKAISRTVDAGRRKSLQGTNAVYLLCGFFLRQSRLAR
jgi:hypothetical protein